MTTRSDGSPPVIDYLTKDYEGFKQGMLSRIPQLLPSWTDRSESDFGVVLIELYAYVADILSYYQDRIANEAFLSTATQRRSVTELLRLIGYEIDPGLAASVVLHIDAAADILVGGDTLPYQVSGTGGPGRTDATFEVTDEFTARVRNNAVDLVPGAQLPAGTIGTAVAVDDHDLAIGDLIYLEERTAQSDGSVRIRRSPMLTVTDLGEVTTGHQVVSWIPPLAAALDPTSTVLKGNNVTATHGRTVADEPVVVSDGTPGQRFELSRSPVTHLLRTGRPSGPQMRVVVDGVAWTRVDTLAASGPSDLHFTTTIDEDDKLTVSLGTGTHGVVPPTGARIVTTYRVGMGPAGNVGPDFLTVPVTTVPEISGVANPFAAEGGADRESTEEAKLAGPSSVIAQDRAVTLEDFELLAAGFPGVGKAKARVGLRGGYKVVQLFIATADTATVPPPPPAAALRSEVKRFLEARMPVNRMAGVDVLAPVFVPVDVVVDVYPEADADRAVVLRTVDATLRDLLSFARQDFGRPLRVGEIFSALYPIAGIDYVVLQRLGRRGETSPPGEAGFVEVVIGENELAYPGEITVNGLGDRT